MIPGKLYNVYTEIVNLNVAGPRFFRDRVPTYKIDPTTCKNNNEEAGSFAGWIGANSVIMFVQHHENTWELLYQNKKIFIPIHHRIIFEEIK